MYIRAALILTWLLLTPAFGQDHNSGGGLLFQSFYCTHFETDGVSYHASGCRMLKGKSTNDVVSELMTYHLVEMAKYDDSDE